MAATLDDLVAVAGALRGDVTAGVDRIVDAIQKGGSGPTPTTLPAPGPGSGGGASDLMFQIAALRVDVRSALDKVVDGMGREKGGADPKTDGGDKPKAFGETITTALDKVTKAGGVARTALSSFADTFDKVVSSLGGGMAKFVQLANPAAVYQFNIATENAMSAIGRILLPAMERATLMIQQLGDAIESLSPRAKQLLSGLALGAGLAGAVAAIVAAIAAVVAVLGGPVTLFIALAAAVAGVMATTSSAKGVMQSFSKVLEAFGEFVEVTASVLMPIIEAVLIPMFEYLAEVLDDVAKATFKLVNAARELLGFDSIKYDPSKNHAEAVRPGQIGDLRGYANRAYTSGFNTSTSIAQNHYDEARTQTGLLRTIARNGGHSGETDPSASAPRRRQSSLTNQVATPLLILARMAARLR